MRIQFSILKGHTNIMIIHSEWNISAYLPVRGVKPLLAFI